MRTLYDPRFEHDACGVGFVVHSSGKATHQTIGMALTALERLAHRGAVAADGRTGDGAGILTAIPRKLLLAEARKRGWTLQKNDVFGVGMLFLREAAEHSVEALNEILTDAGCEVIGWRVVPVDAEQLGERAAESQPDIRQILVRAHAGVSESAFERQLYLARKRFEREALPGYVCSLSCHTIVYKGLCSGNSLGAFYRDLADPAYESSFVLFHQRYSTNTLPSWELAQPLRLLAHNGEINTLWANRAWLRARDADLPVELKPLFNEAGSDSATLDETLELITRGGRDLDRALGMLIVPGWDATSVADAYHRFNSAVMEPWDGPAALTFSDGVVVGAALDRNGLRPCRYALCGNGLVVAGSEVGLFDLDEDDVVEKGRLGPGQMLLVDLAGQRVLHNAEIRARHAAAQPYERWIGARRFGSELIETAPEARDDLTIDALHHIFGFTAEDLKFVLSPMADDGKEPIWSMGDDTPVPPLARSPRPLYNFLRQRFAQVTNPPIDPLRETVLMSLRTWLGPRRELLTEGPQPVVFELPSPVVTRAQLARLRKQRQLELFSVDCTWVPADELLPAAIERVCKEAAAAVRAGAQLVLLTDRAASVTRAPLPMALVVGAVHHYLLRKGLRTRTGLIADAGDCWDVHHIAVLIGCGAGAVCPWLAAATASSIQPENGEARLLRVYETGLLKVISKLGISAIGSYRGGQFFEVLGLGDDVVKQCFTGTPSRIGGLNWDALQQLLTRRHETAVAPPDKLPDHGLVRFRRGAEFHAWQPLTVRALQKAVGAARGGDQPDAGAWTEFTQLAAGEAPGTLRGLLDYVAAGASVSLAETEPVEAIAQRFIVSAMSLGALSPEAHATLTIAMNRLGARSNTGEGGEDPALYVSHSGERLDSKIKQVASGRFGVTAAYLARAEELEIKIAQGSKPGEGGQLPGAKVTELIARLRHAQVGQSLISPPPHHDIYSIEDIAQLIYDLKRINPRAAVGVKLVAEAGVGTIAAGVAKARADYVCISGHSGGTGASPLSSIKNAGAPWELGLAETHQVLLRNGLRSAVRVRVDGGLMTAADVLVATLLGADEFGFGTAPLVALGCDMARQCHLNSCPTGIATQQPELRAKFRGSPELVERYFRMLAEDIRRLLSLLGLRSIREAVGRVDLLRQVRFDAGLDLSPLLAPVDNAASRQAFEDELRDEPADEALAREALAVVTTGAPFTADRPIRNSDRTMGARIAGELALRRLRGEQTGSVQLRFTGFAGQSFGAFCTEGMRLELNGEANDYVGKGLCGAELVLRPAGAARTAPHRNVIMGNVVLYGATSGHLFAAGVAGERFAVRNSGAIAVVEGVGDHGCEYMTGGVVVVLGETGINFGAGMTGGTAFVYDEHGNLPARRNADSVDCVRPAAAALKGARLLVERHAALTGSVHAAQLLVGWRRASRCFWQVVPRVAVPAVRSIEVVSAEKPH